MTNPHLPPAYVSIPIPVANAFDVDDAVLVTMIRLLGLCWNRERTPPLTPDELAQAVGRSRSALYRHLRLLKDDDEGGQNPGCLRWIQVEQVNRRITIHPLVPVAKDDQVLPDSADDAPPPRRPPDGAPANGELDQALRAIGVENPKRDQLARRDIDPAWVYAWDLWARHPRRQGLTNPVGYVIRKLESGEPPPDEFLRDAARLPAPATSPRDEAWRHRHSPAPKPEPEARPAPSEADRLWARSLDALQWQMERAAFDAWLRDSRVLAAEGHRLTIGVQDVRAVEWLQKRLMHVVRRAVDWHAGWEIEIAFTTLLQATQGTGPARRLIQPLGLTSVGPRGRAGPPTNAFPASVPSPARRRASVPSPARRRASIPSPARRRASVPSPARRHASVPSAGRRPRHLFCCCCVRFLSCTQRKNNSKTSPSLCTCPSQRWDGDRRVRPSLLPLAMTGGSDGTGSISVGIENPAAPSPRGVQQGHGWALTTAQGRLPRPFGARSDVHEPSNGRTKRATHLVQRAPTCPKGRRRSGPRPRQRTRRVRGGPRQAPTRDFPP